MTKKKDLLSFQCSWLLFVLSLVARLLCLPPHCVLAMKWRKAVQFCFLPYILILECYVCSD